MLLRRHYVSEEVATEKVVPLKETKEESKVADKPKKKTTKK